MDDNFQNIIKLNQQQKIMNSVVIIFGFTEILVLYLLTRMFSVFEYHCVHLFLFLTIKTKTMLHFFMFYIYDLTLP